MSKIILTLSNQTASSVPFWGAFTVVYNYGLGNVNLRLNLGENRSGSFEWRGVPDNGINGSSRNYAAAINRDFRNIGGTNNISASVTANNKVTIEAKKGEFISASENSNIAGLFYVLDNTPEALPIVLLAEQTVTGDCDTINFNVSASGGTPPFTLQTIKSLGTWANEQTGWNGSETAVSILRNTAVSFKVVDSVGEEKDTIYYIVPRNIQQGDFKINSTLLYGSTDVVVDTLVKVEGTNPLEYSLNGVDYQTSNSFPGLLDGTYKIRIRDKYGCVVSKSAVLISLEEPEQNATQSYYNHLFVSNFNSIAFSPKQQFDAFNKKNYDNTLSYNEYVKLPYNETQKFIEGDIDNFGVGTQFQSGYPYNIVTLHKCDGSKVNLAPILIQENLGSEEKVDCVVFPVNGKTGVYFDGGNTYLPYTSTISGESEYIQFLPDWAVSGQKITIDSLGSREILDFGYDPNIDKNYFVVNGTIGEQKQDKVQVKYDVQNYNIYESYLDVAQLSSKGVITIESGFDYDQINQTWVSEVVEKINDTDEYLLLEWSSFKNVQEMVFTSGIKGIMRIKGKIRPFPKGESENTETDTGSYPLKQSASMGMLVYIPVATPKVWDKLNAVSGLSIVGEFKINNIDLVRSNPIEVEEKGDTNLSDVTMEFDYGYNYLTSRQDEIVLNVSTGVVGGGLTSKNGVINIEPVNIDDKILVVDELGRFLVSNDGRFFTAS